MPQTGIVKSLILTRKAKNHTGKQFGRLTVIKPVGLSSHGGYVLWECSCSCGNTSVVNSRHLVSGGTKSCGCLAKELSARRIKELHNTGDHLYFIQCGDYIKIGRANNVWQRVGQLRAANPYPIELINMLENQGYREKEFHEKFKGKHHTGEWFMINGCEVVDIN